MMLEEFEQRIGFYPTLVQYAAIERVYMEFNGDKDVFCKACKKNVGGIAERIQREVNAEPPLFSWAAVSVPGTENPPQ